MERQIALAITLILINIVIGGWLTIFIRAFLSSTDDTPDADITLIVKAMNLKVGDRFADLGSGSGKMLSSVYPITQTKVTGIELSPLPALLSKYYLLLKPFFSKPIQYEILAENFLNGKIFTKIVSENDVLYINSGQNVINALGYMVRYIKENADTNKRFNRVIRFYTYNLKFPELEQSAEYELKSTKLYEYKITV